MASENLLSIVEQCMENENASCVNSCPFELDVKGLIKKIKKKDFNGAYKIYRNQVVFPEIVSKICHKPCESACVRKDSDNSVSINDLERALVKHASNKKPIKFNLPSKEKKVVIIGAGLTGLTCALRMATRKYDVTIYEKTDKVGGRLSKLMEESVYTEEIERQFENVTYSLNLNANIKNLESLDFDVALIATGAGGVTFGRGEQLDVGSLGTTREGVFIGGNVIGTLPVESIDHGIRAADAMEKYLKIGSMDGYPEK